MREAPSLCLRGRGHCGWQRFVRIGCGTAAGVLLLWLQQWHTHAEPDWAHLGTALGLLVVLIGVAATARQPAFELQWTAGCWQWRLDPPSVDTPWWAGEPIVRIDAGRWLLLELHPAGRWRRSWLALAEADLPAHWHLLRCALYSPRRMNAPLPTPIPTAPAVRPSADDR